MAKARRILVDMDGILADLQSPWIDAYNRETGDSLAMSDVTDWGIENFMTRMDEPWDILRRPGFFAQLEPLPGAVEGFKALQEMGHEILICSSPASAESAKDKILWCKDWLGVERRDIALMHKKSWLSGTCDVLIDDKPATIRQWAAAGKDAITLAYPYNAEVDHLCARVPSWGHIVDILSRRVWR